MTTVASELVMRRHISEAAGAPGTIAVVVRPALLRRGDVARSTSSSRKSDKLLAASGPWHTKQLLDRIGRTSRLNQCSAGSEDESEHR
jgi:hypothetical protein